MKAYEAQPIEVMIRIALQSGEPLGDGIPLNYPETPDKPSSTYNIRTDKWEIAQNAIGERNKAKAAQGDGKLDLGDEGMQDGPGKGPEK